MIGTGTISTRLLRGFDDPAPNAFEAPAVFATAGYQQAWWDAFGRGRLMLMLAEEHGEAVVYAPLFADCGMIYFVGSGGSDYLDIRGQASGERLAAVLAAASERVENFAGCVFYHVPDDSPTGAHLQSAATRLGWRLYDEGEQAAPALDLLDREVTLAAMRKKSLVRHENALRRAGRVEVHHFRDGGAILPQLDAFFAQHIARWAATPYPSLFLDPKQRAFYRGLCATAGHSDWLRFTRIDLDGRAVAYHLGFCYRGVYLWYKPAFEIALAKRSPGEVLLRQLLLAAMEEGARVFDFGLGDEAFKQRFATRVRKVRNYGLYPPVAGRNEYETRAGHQPASGR